MALASYAGSLATSIVLQQARHFSELLQQEPLIFSLFGVRVQLLPLGLIVDCIFSYGKVRGQYATC